MRVAVVGTRGMPGVHGGIERHVEELCPRLAALGVEMTVYARREYVPYDLVHEGVKVVALPSFGGRYGEALSHTARAMFHARRGAYDVLHVHAIGPGILLPLARLCGFRRTVLTAHARDYERAKWGRFAKAFLRLSERVGAKFATEMIAVSEHDAALLRRRYSREVHAIPNGPGKLMHRPPGQLLADLGLQGEDYVLFVGRLIPEKCPEDLLAAVTAIPGLHVVFAGDSSFTDDYTRALHAAAGPRTHFPGYMYGAQLEELYSSALAFALPSEVEGLSISLLEAMSYGLPVVVSNIPGNVEALGDPASGIVYPVRNCVALTSALKRLAGDPSLREQLGQAAKARVHEVFDWDVIARRTLNVYERAISS